MSKANTTLDPADIAAEHPTEMIDLLNQQLADLMDLYSQTKFAHWNVRGATFIALHKLFDELAEKVEDAVDEVAERATALGGIALGTVRLASKKSRLEEFPRETSTCENVVKVLSARYASVARSLRAAIKEADEADDAGTADLFTQTSRMLDESLYFLRSNLQS